MKNHATLQPQNVDPDGKMTLESLRPAGFEYPGHRWIMSIQTIIDRGTTTVIALCNDSSVWICQFKQNESLEWLPLPLMPQEEINPNHTLTVT